MNLWSLLEKVILSDKAYSDRAGLSADMSATAKHKALARLLRERDSADGVETRPGAYTNPCKALVDGSTTNSAVGVATKTMTALEMRDDDRLIVLGKAQLTELSQTQPVKEFRWVSPKEFDQFASDVAEMWRITYLYLLKATDPSALMSLIANEIEYAAVVPHPYGNGRLAAFIRLRALTHHGIKAIEDNKATSGFDLMPGERPPLVQRPVDGPFSAPSLYVTMVVDTAASRSLLRRMLGYLKDYEGPVFTKPSTDAGRRFCENRCIQVNDNIWRLDPTKLEAFVSDDPTGVQL